MDQAGFFDIKSFVLSSSAVYFHEGKKSYPFSRPEHGNFEQHLVFTGLLVGMYFVICTFFQGISEKGPVRVMESKHIQPFVWRGITAPAEQKNWAPGKYLGETQQPAG